MGRVNLAVNQMLERKEIFADMINGVLFNGEKILDPENMELVSGNSGLYYEEDGEKHLIERRGDVRMKVDLGIYSIFVLNETQARVHYAMPVRDMLYAALEYMKQVKNLEKKNLESEKVLKDGAFLSNITKEDRISPVMTIVLYCGDKEWDGSKSLYEFFEVEQDTEEMELIRKYVPDYPINLIHISNIENTEIFTISLQNIFDMVKLNKSRSKKDLYQYIENHKKELSMMDSVETLAAFVLLGETKTVEKNGQKVLIHIKAKRRKRI